MALKKRVIVVGLGSIGRRHARLLCEREDIVLEFCEPNERALRMARSELGGLPAYASYDDALASRPDLVVVATPHRYHCEQTVRALEQDIHVLCEKPMSDGLVGARKMQVAAERSRAVLSIGFMLHFHPGVGRLKHLIQSGTLGTILQIQYKVGSYITLANSQSRYQASLEGALLLDYAHQPDIIYWLLQQKPRGVYMAAGRGGQLEFTANPNYLAMVCDYDTPLLSTIELNYLQMPERHECEIIGDEGWALLDFARGALRIGEKHRNRETEEKIEAVRDDMYRQEHQAFLDAIEGKRAPASPAEEAIVAMEIIDAALASWRTGARVTLAHAADERA